jgi:hypothetical protein
MKSPIPNGFRAKRIHAGIAPATRRLGRAILVLALALSGALLPAIGAIAQQGGGSAATQQGVPGTPAPERIQPWGLPPPPPGVGPVCRFLCKPSTHSELKPSTILI